MSAIPMKMRFNVDLQDPLVTQVLTTVLQQGDSGANVVEITLKNGGATAALNGNTVLAYFLRADGERVRIEGEIDNEMIKVELTAECYQVNGPAGAFVRLEDEAGNKRTILRFAVNVESEGDGPIIDPSNRIPSVEDIIAKMEEMEEAIKKAEQATQNAENAARPPYIGENGRWFTWGKNQEEYVDSGVEAQGPKGETGDKGDKGDKGNTGGIMGVYGTLDELIANQPEPEQGDMYLIGEAPPYKQYVWMSDEFGEGWMFAGPMMSANNVAYEGTLPDEQPGTVYYGNAEGALNNHSKNIRQLIEGMETKLSMYNGRATLYAEDWVVTGSAWTQSLSELGMVAGASATVEIYFADLLPEFQDEDGNDYIDEDGNLLADVIEWSSVFSSETVNTLTAREEAFGLITAIVPDKPATKGLLFVCLKEPPAVDIPVWIRVVKK